VLTAEQLETMQAFHRYLDVDGDGIPYRTLPGTHPRGAYFTRGSGHNKLGGYTEDSTEYQEVMDRLTRKFEGAASALPEPVVVENGADIGLITIGGCDGGVREAAASLARDGVPVDVLRVRAFPFHPTIRRFIDAHRTNIVIEQNRDGQLRNMLIMELGIAPERLESIRVYGGLPLSRKHVVEGVAEILARRNGGPVHPNGSEPSSGAAVVELGQAGV
jgi:2-oxoglutarate/2-oxoacid ferredoxin oxidoreductase subunit alpha